MDGKILVRQSRAKDVFLNPSRSMDVALYINGAKELNKSIIREGEIALNTVRSMGNIAMDVVDRTDRAGSITVNTSRVMNNTTENIVHRRNKIVNIGACNNATREMEMGHTGILDNTATSMYVVVGWVYRPTASMDVVVRWV